MVITAIVEPDGVSLNGKSTRQQIAALKSGTMYAKDYQREWPYCTVYARNTNLEGFGPAYDRLVQVAKDRGLVR
ncbi:hypothetical protein [Tateyamaria sp. Alg231-49]|uniref:hypothetical protein n=1 Tax=Tateyamaria sp. Alg231-49 TaxID=1922219 RepID=UPI000D55D2D8|nr:hypothetical protein [Tateyamaria sp. Alg231-49]